jgi:hypothetical protein
MTSDSPDNPESSPQCKICKEIALAKSFLPYEVTYLELGCRKLECGYS